MFDPNAYDVEPRRKFKAVEAAQFIIILLLLIAAGKLIYDGPTCDHYDTWIKFMFYGALIWMVYIVVTQVVQFRNEGMRVFIGYIDYLFLASLIFIWIWGYVLLADKDGHQSCSERWRFFSRAFWIYGWAVLICIICVIFMTILRLLNNKMSGNKGELALHAGHHHGDYEVLDKSAL